MSDDNSNKETIITESDWMNAEYAATGKVPKSFSEINTVNISPFIPKITKADVDNNFITRYFCRRVNDPKSDIVEVSEQDFNKLKNSSLYLTISIPWRISGRLDDIFFPNSNMRQYTGVITANTLITEEADKEMPGIKYLLIKPTQFFR